MKQADPASTSNWLRLQFRQQNIAHAFGHSSDDVDQSGHRFELVALRHVCTNDIERNISLLFMRQSQLADNLAARPDQGFRICICLTLAC